MGQYPVISITLKQVKGSDFASARAQMWNVISREAGRLAFLHNSENLDQVDKELFYRLRTKTGSLEDALLVLSELLYKHYGKKVIILIDEYDVPIQMVIPNREISNLFNRQIRDWFFARIEGGLQPLFQAFDVHDIEEIEKRINACLIVLTIVIVLLALFVTVIYFPKFEKYVQIICMIPYTIQGIILSVSILSLYVGSNTFLSKRMRSSRIGSFCCATARARSVAGRHFFMSWGRFSAVRCESRWFSVKITMYLSLQFGLYYKKLRQGRTC